MGRHKRKVLLLCHPLLSSLLSPSPSASHPSHYLKCSLVATLSFQRPDLEISSVADPISLNPARDFFQSESKGVKRRGIGKRRVLAVSSHVKGEVDTRSVTNTYQFNRCGIIRDRSVDASFFPTGSKFQQLY